jgi:transposase
MSHWNFSIQDVRRLLRGAVEHELSTDAVQRLKWFAYALEHESNVSLTCRHFGISRSTFLRWAERFDGNADMLDDHSRRPHTMREPETNPKVVELIKTIRTEHVTMGKEHVCTMLRETYGVTVSVSTVGRVINRHKFFFADTAAHRAKRGDDVSEDNTATSTALPLAEGGLSTDMPFSPEPELNS